jgi:hypothetical protein
MGEALANYVRNGGGLVACGNVAAVLASETLKSGNTWMGVWNSWLFGGFQWVNMPGGGIPLPSPFLGVDLGPDRQWMPLGQGQIVAILISQASGHMEIKDPETNMSSTYAVSYTAQIGKGRFFFLSSCANLDLQPALRKALFAGIRWVMAN